MEVNERMKKYRVRQRASGLRLVQLWVPDTRSPVFAAECRRQSALLRGDPAESEALAFIGETAAWTDDAPR
jgi:hypothetical protein